MRDTFEGSVVVDEDFAPVISVLLVCLGHFEGQDDTLQLSCVDC